MAQRRPRGERRPVGLAALIGRSPGSRSRCQLLVRGSAPARESSRPRRGCLRARPRSLLGGRVRLYRLLHPDAELRLSARLPAPDGASTRTLGLRRIEARIPDDRRAARDDLARRRPVRMVAPPLGSQRLELLDRDRTAGTDASPFGDLAVRPLFRARRLALRDRAARGADPAQASNGRRGCPR